MEMRKFFCVILLNFFSSIVLVENVMWSNQSCMQISYELNLHCFFDCSTAFCRPFGNSIQCNDIGDGVGWCRIENVAKQDLEFCDDVSTVECVEPKISDIIPHFFLNLFPGGLFPGVLFPGGLFPAPVLPEAVLPETPEVHNPWDVRPDIVWETRPDVVQQSQEPIEGLQYSSEIQLQQSQVRIELPDFQQQQSEVPFGGHGKEFEDLNKNCLQTCNGNEEICLYHQFPNVHCSVNPMRGGGRKQCRITPSKYPKCTWEQLWGCTDCAYTEPICDPHTGKCSRDGYDMENACFIEDTSDVYCSETESLNYRCASQCADHTFCQTWGHRHADNEIALICGDFKDDMKRVGLCKMNPSPIDDFITVNVENRCYRSIYFDLTYMSRHRNRMRSHHPMQLRPGSSSFPDRIPAEVVSARVLVYDTPAPNFEKMERGLAEFTATKSEKGMNIISYDLSNVDSTFLPMEIYGIFFGRGTCHRLQCGSGSELDMTLCPHDNRRVATSGREFCLSTAQICSTDYDNNKRLCTSFDRAIAECKQNVRYCDLCAVVPGMYNSSTSCTTQDVLSCTGYFAGHHPKEKGCAQENILFERDTPDCNYHGREICAMLNRRISSYTTFVRNVCDSAVSFSQDHWEAPHRMQHCMTNEVTVVACP